MADLTINLGQGVLVALDGHSAMNGAPIPDGSTIALASNDPTVATLPASVPVPAGGAQHIEFDATVVGTGSTDFTADVTTPDGSVFHASATLLVNPAPTPGLVSVTMTLTAK